MRRPVCQPKKEAGKAILKGNIKKRLYVLTASALTYLHFEYSDVNTGKVKSGIVIPQKEHTMRPKNICIKINNWSEYNNYRARELKTPHWFAMSNRFDTSESLMNVSLMSKLLFVYMLCIASRKSTDTIEINLDVYSMLWRCSVNDVLMSVRQLERNQVLTRKSRVMNAEKSCTQKKTRQDNTNTTQNKEVVEVFGEIELMNLWNKTKSEKQPVALKMTRERREAAQLALRELPERAQWEKIFSGVSKSPFHNGENKTKWCADFNWCLKVERSIRFLETPEPREEVYFK